MSIPQNCILLRQFSGACEVVRLENGVESILFTGGRIAAKKFLAESIKSPGFAGVAVYNRKRGGALVRLN